MKKIIPILFVFFLIYGLTNKSDILIPSYAIRFRIIASSNSDVDQETKITIKNDLEPKLNSLMSKAKNSNEAKALLKENETLIKNTLDKYNVAYQISLGKNYFPEKEYQGVKIPSGNYESLVITLGEGAGKNWWCVAFPELCFSATSEDFCETAQTAGMNQGLTESLTQEDCSIRFFLLDALGQLETKLESYPFFGTNSVVS